MHPDPIINEEKYADWNNPYYMAGFSAALATINVTDTDLDKAHQKIALLELSSKLSNEKIEELEDIIDLLKQPWYIKLWNKIPRFSLSIRRTN